MIDDDKTPSTHTPSPPSRGIIDVAISRLLGTSWRTTLLGAVSLACGVMPLIPGAPPVLVQLAQYLAPLAVGSGLIVARDHGAPRP